MADCYFENLPQQQTYGTLLKWGGVLGVSLLIGTFGLYALDILPPLIEIQTVTHFWHLPLQDYLNQTQSPKGWQWLQYLHRGDYLSFAAITWLPLLSALCYSYLAFTFLRDRDYRYFSIALAQLTFIFFSAANLWPH